ncbi:MAG: polysaccharide deacetylase family protein [Flavobacteriales bacterium]|jgi:peptidoglycan/xylan/chitin deacetylase (PgdA/CDA1 family)
MYFVKTPDVLKPLAKDLLWHVHTTRKEIYLTFDDGPTPGVTEQALDILRAYNAHATFFCLGKNVELYPSIFERITAEGHTVGNHSYDHPDGWKTAPFSYLRNVTRAGNFISSSLFRPPYGRITPAQVSALKKRYTLVMWDVLSADFDLNKTPEQCLKHVTENGKPGSIVVFHDSVKAERNMRFALEGSLAYFSEQGYIFRALSHA